MKRKFLYYVATVAAVAGAAAGSLIVGTRAPAPAPAPAAAAAPAQSALDTSAIANDMRALLDAYRKIIVLTQDEAALSSEGRALANRVGQALFHENQERIARLDAAIAGLMASNSPARFEAIGGLLDYVESGEGLYDADRLAFRELMQSLLGQVAADSSLPAIKLHKRVSEDLDALAEIERNYEKEIRAVFGRFESRSIELKREKWGSYVAYLQTLYQRERILKDYGVVLPYPSKPEPQAPSQAGREEEEIFGKALPKKTIVLTFDDGPHRRYSDEIAAILKQYNAPAVFFSVGRNLGSLDAQGKATLNGGAQVSRRLKQAGYVLANHSFSHAQLSKQTGDNLKAEILHTDALLKAVDPERSALFRFPYGARNREGMQLLENAHLKSVMWNIDSLDWADPVPSSIAERVLRTVDKEGRGIILFHDIHERTVKALPAILDRLTAEGYQFAGWDGQTFKTAATAAPAPAPAARAAATGYANSWAIVVGIDKYQKWPQLQYAVRDAEGVGQLLVRKFGFAPERVLTLKNEQATRAGILAAFHDRLAHGNLQPNDRIFVFFAGHGATRRLSSGRDLGYIVPVDADPDKLATDAIPMTEIQNIAESLPAKHALFVMDACYSGLGLTRGAANGSFLRDNARRLGRQMLTAGGTDQLVSDGGPNGHSVFTWTLLQALGGKADLNGDGLITGTELAAYVAPAVSSVSQQTPAFGSLPGSEGGEFVFELPEESEYLNTATTQLSNDAIALNTRLDAKTPAATVVVKDLQGGETRLTAPAAVPLPDRLKAQRSNDQGLLLYKEKQYAQAEAQFTEALKLRPNFALAANNLGFVFYRQEKYAEAARWFENAVKMDPSRAIAYMNLGDAYFRSGDKEKAKAAYKTYLELTPNGAEAGYARQQLEKT